jgi:hypothetical protein
MTYAKLYGQEAVSYIEETYSISEGQRLLSIFTTATKASKPVEYLARHAVVIGYDKSAYIQILA